MSGCQWPGLAAIQTLPIAGAWGSTVFNQWLESGSYPGFPGLACSVEVLTPISEQKKCFWEVGRQWVSAAKGMDTKCFIIDLNKTYPSSNYCEKNIPRISNIILLNFCPQALQSTLMSKTKPNQTKNETNKQKNHKMILLCLLVNAYL